MIKFFKNNKKEKDAERIYKIYANINIAKRIKYIVDSEYKRMIYLAEKAALNGETSLSFNLTVDERDEIYFNRILYRFINKLVDNGFRYSRQMLTAKNKLTIYFSKIDIDN